MNPTGAMITLSDGSQVPAIDYHTALILEARRQGISDGKLVEKTDRQDREKIVEAYLRKKQGRWKPKPRRTVPREGTLAWRLTHEDFSRMTVAEIAKAVGKSENRVYIAMRKLRDETGFVVPYRKNKKGRKKERNDGPVQI